MLRQVFYAKEMNPVCELDSAGQGNPDNSEAVCFGTSCVLPSNAIYSDAKPREVFIAVCFLIPIIAIGLYPKVAMQIYDAKTVALNSQVRQSRLTSPLVAKAKANQNVSNIAAAFAPEL